VASWADGVLPSDFEVPELLEAGRFRLRPLTVHDVVKDDDTVMSSREHLREQFAEVWGWPPADLTLGAGPDRPRLAVRQRPALARGPLTGKARVARGYTPGDPTAGRRR
jgi:hypothetical protein